MNVGASNPMGSGFRGLILAVFFAAFAPAQEQVLREAERLDSEHQCAEAERYYRKALTAGTPSPALLNNLGNHYLTCGATDKARDAFERLLRINPAHVNGNLQMARLAVEARDGARALTYLRRLPDDDAEVLLVRAEAMQLTGRQNAASDAIAEAGKIAGNDARILFAIGMTCGRVGLYAQAEKAFSAALVQYPGEYDLLYNLGLAAARAGHYDRALSAFERAAQAKPGDADPLYELGRAESNLHDYNRAVYLLAQARKLAPQRADVALALARAAQMAGFYGDSLAAYDDYLKLQPADDLVRRDQALLRGYSHGGLEEGLKDLTDYVKKHPQDAVGYYDLAQLYERGDRSRALELVTTAVRFNPELEPAHFFRAWLLQKLGRERESVDEISVDLRLNPANVRALDLLGLDYLDLENAVEAEKVLRRASALAPDEPDVLFHLSRALMEQGRTDEAKPFLDRFEKVKQRGAFGPREEAGVIESAGLSPEERSKRVIEELKQLVRDHPGERALRVNLGAALLAQGTVAEGLAAFRELLALQPDSAISHQAGTALLGFEQYGLAREFLERAVDRPGARMDLAIALFFADSPGQALAVLGKVPEGESPGDYLLLKARILDAAGQRTAADDALEESLRYNPSRPRLAEQAALLLVAHGRNAKALDLLAKALGSAPDDPRLMLARVAVLSASDRNREAEEAVREIENRWPEWDQAYLVEGLVMERDSRPANARQRIEIARVLGIQGTAARCALRRMTEGPEKLAAECSCQPGVYAPFFPSCGEPSR